MTINVLFVDTGGVCRGPMAVGVLRSVTSRAGLAQAFDLDFAATFDGHAGRPPTPLAVETAGRRGYDIAGLRARVLDPDEIGRCAYPLAMDRTHLAAMRMMAPGGFTDRPQLLLRFRGDLGVTDIADPYGGSLEEYEHALDLIERGCEGLLRHVCSTLAPRPA